MSFLKKIKINAETQRRREKLQKNLESTEKTKNFTTGARRAQRF